MPPNGGRSLYVPPRRRTVFVDGLPLVLASLVFALCIHPATGTAYCDASVRGGYACMKVVGTSVVHWSLSDDQYVLDMAVEVPGNGWVGVGFSSFGFMVASDAVIGGLEGLDAPEAFSLQAKVPSGVQRRPFATWLLHASLHREGVGSVLEFSRMMSGGSVDVAAGGTALIVAFHVSSRAVVHHSGRASFPIVLDQRPRQLASPTLTLPAPTPSPPETEVPEVLTPVPVVGMEPVEPEARQMLPCTVSTLKGSTRMAQGELEDADSFDCMYAHEPRLVLHWGRRAVEGRVFTRFVLVSSIADGWLGVSFPDKPATMEPARALIVKAAEVTRYFINGGQSASSLFLVDGLLSNIYATDTKRKNGKVYLYFTHNENATGAKDPSAAFAVPMAPTFHINGAAGDTLVEGHSASWGITVNVRAGTMLSYWKPTVYHSEGRVLTHAIVMGVVWMVCVPTAILIKKFARTMCACDSQVFGVGVATAVHGVAMLVSVIITIVAGCHALATFDHGTTLGHREVGITLMPLLVLQCIMPFVRPAEARDPNTVHRWAFRITHASTALVIVCLAYTQVITGTFNYQRLFPDSSSVTVALRAVLGSCLAVCLIVGVVLRIKRSMVVSRPRQEVPTYFTRDPAKSEGAEGGGEVVFKKKYAENATGYGDPA